MVTQIRKRDGRIESFNKQKIIDAIGKAMKDANDRDMEIAYKIAEKIENSKADILDVEEIQDMVEGGLMASRRKDVAKAYILYRDERTRERTKNAKLTKLIAEKITASNVLGQNANVDERSFGGRRGEAINEYMKQYALDYCVSEMARNNHINNEVYIHDLDHYAIGDHNCMSIPFDHLLANGFTTRQTDVRPANSINTAFQLIAVIFQLQSLQQFGGCSATHLDWTMVPYVRKSFKKHWNDGIEFLAPQYKDDAIVNDDMPISDYYTDGDFIEVYNYAMKMTERELKQAAEGMYHNLNTLQSRSGNQLKL